MADGATRSLGLVPSKTSSTLGRVVGVVTPENTHRARLKRMRRTVLNSCRSMVRSRRGFRDRWLMQTLTYRPGLSWTSKHVSEFLNRMGMWLRRRRAEFSYVWVLELTKAGVPHYHVLVRVPYGVRIPRADDAGWWQHGSTRTEQARGPVGYLAKYASKGGSAADFPKGARLHGAAGLNRDLRTVVQFWNLPVWCRERLAEITRVARDRGGFVVCSTGEFLPTPYEVIFRAGNILIVEKDKNHDPYYRSE